jgi:hypothetical protein
MKRLFFLLLTATLLSGVANAQCKCGASPTANNWSAFTATVPLPVRTVKCGHQFKICNGDSIALKGKFNCVGGCNAYYKTVLKKNGTIVQEEGFEMAEIFYQKRLPIPGNYELTITPVCGGNLCRPCTFYITVVKCR